MLLNLHVKNFAIIDEIDVYFNDRLNILTGETGAGKSIILGSINIALGGKVNKDMIRKGAEYALVELVFQIEDVHTIEKLKELDIYVEDGQVAITRKILNGRVINKINGENVQTITLRKAASYLIDIHGQHEHQSLLYKSKHMSILDRYAKSEVEELRKLIYVHYQEYQKLCEEIEGATVSDDTRLREISFLEYEINEITNARLKVGEDEELSHRYRVMSNANLITENLNQVYAITGESNEAVSEQVSRALRYLSKVSEIDGQLGGLCAQLMDVESLLNDFNRELSEYMMEQEFDQEEFQKLEDRLTLINNMKSKYGNSIEEILKYQEEANEKLFRYQQYDLYLNELQEKKTSIEKKLETECLKLTKQRKEASLTLKTLITDALRDLNFDNVQFEIEVRPLNKYTMTGADDVEFMISTNLGEDVKPLSKVASGGELSRIMLAIKSVLAKADAVDTLIFDEIDVGISGRTAQKVSERMAYIASSHQVLCITHLPQIAAMADTHYVIEKISETGRTVTNIRELDESLTIEELARTLGGAEITSTVLDNAREMKKLADEVKRNIRN